MFKKVVIKLDNDLLNSYLRGIYQRFNSILTNRKYNSELSGLNGKFTHSYLVRYNKSQSNMLSILCDYYGSDKGSADINNKLYDWYPHTYTDFYDNNFYYCRRHIKKVFECGIGTDNLNLRGNMGENAKPGASLKVWRDYFPNAIIVGADIDKEILFSDERVSTYFVDQASKQSVLDMWYEIGLDDFDLIIDDGLHTYQGGVCLFENSVEYLSGSGIYVIEDVKLVDLVKYEKYFKNYKYRVDFISLYRNDCHLLDNSLVVIRK